jgi:type IV secretory pathway protease TraF
MLGVPSGTGIVRGEKPRRTEASLDGRYFGPLPRDTIVGRAVPIWTREG